LVLKQIRHEKEQYAALTADIVSILPLLIQWAGNEDAELARKAKYLLIHTGNNAIAGQFLLQEWQHNASNNARRGYALHALCHFYIINDQTDQLINMLATAFDNETNVFLRFTLATYLVQSSQENAESSWLAELQHALADVNAINQDFGSMIPFTGNGDLEEYIILLLSKVHPEALEKNIASMIEALPTLHELKQVKFFRAIFAVIFRERTDLQNITPIRKKALLAAADIVLKDPRFVNRIEVFKAYGLPHDTYSLRQLAETAANDIPPSCERPGRP
jgi:hypothetical protein